MLKAVVLQWSILVVASCAAMLLAGPPAGWSAALGGMAVAIPSSLFAARLGLHRGRGPESYPVVFFLGLFIKIGLTVLLFSAVIFWDGEKHWLALITGFILTLKAPLLAVFWLSESDEPLYCKWEPGVIRRQEPERDPWSMES